MKKSEVYMGTLVKPWMSNKNIKYITFSVTDDCNLMCKYCYFTHKTNKNKLSFDVAKEAIDYILSEPMFLIHDGVVWDFIGGEPTLEMELIDKICDYILYKMYALNHKWLYCYRIMIGTNGLLYNSPRFQSFLRKHGKNLHVNITVDGSKEKHDLSRIKKDGSGSYDDIIKILPLWFRQTGNYSTKSTFAHADLPYLKDSIINLWNLGFKNVMANVVFENVWNENDDIIYEKQLRDLADYIIDNRLWNDVSVRFFSPSIGYPIEDVEMKSNYCGSGNMLAIDYRGNFYPCVRFMDSALNNHTGRIIGNFREGINTEKIRAFNALSTECESPQKCLDCEVSKGCSWCSGFNYDDSKDGTIFERKTYHCAMHKANVRANNYFWERYERATKNISPLRYNKYTSQSSKNKYLYILNDNSFEFCNINSSANIAQKLSDEIYAKAIKYCDRYNYIPVHVGFNEQREFGYYIGNVSATYERNEMTVDVLSSKDLENTSLQTNRQISDSVIFRLMIDELENLKAACVSLFEKGVKKINIVLVEYETLSKQQLISYLGILNDLVLLIITKWKENSFVQIDVITDNLFLDKKTFCSAVNSMTLAPDGYFYPCQAYYFHNNSRIASIDDFEDIPRMRANSLSMCNKCEVYSCKKCAFLNQKTTCENAVPFESHCIKANLELKASVNLLRMLEDEGITLPFDINKSLRCSRDLDPLITLRGDSFITKGLNSILP